MHYNLGATNGNRKNRDNVEYLCQRISYAYKVCHGDRQRLLLII